jgi:hypothetical protein
MASGSDPTMTDGTRVSRTTATRASTPRSEDIRKVGGVENASVVRDKFLAAADKTFKDFTDSKKDLIDNSLESGAVERVLKCKSAGTGDLDIPSYTSELRNELQKSSELKILAYSQTMPSKDAAEQAYAETAESLRTSPTYRDLATGQINTQRVNPKGQCGRLLLEELKKLAEEFVNKEPDEAIFNKDKTDQLRDLTDNDKDKNKRISLSDPSVQEALATINDPPPTPEEVAQQKRFEEQCFLIKYANKLPGVSLPVTSKKVFKLGSAEKYTPDGFVNQLVKPPNYEQIFNITPAQLSGLTPSIELYKVFIDDDGKEADVPIIMNTHTTKDEIDSFLGVYEVAQTYPLGRSRSIGAGMKSMTMEFDGNNFFTAKRNIKSKLKLFFASFEELLRSRRVTVTEQNGPGFESVDSGFRFIDLMMKTPSTIKPHRSSHQLDPNPRNYRLKAVFGWSELGGNQVLSDFSSPQKKVKEAILNSSITIQLIPVTHTINVGEQGQVEVEIDYRAYIDSITGAVYSNILATEELYRELFDYDDVIKRAKRDKGCKNEKISAYKKEAIKKIDKQEEIALTSILRDLDTTGKITHLTVDYRDIKETGDAYSMEVTNYTTGAGNKIATAIEKASRDAKQAGDSGDSESGSLIPALTPDGVIVSYIYLSDILDVVINKIELSLSKTKNGRNDIEIHYEQFKKIRVILGPSIINLPTKGGYEMNIGDIPISLTYFAEFLMSKTIKEGISQYTLFQFLSDFMNDFVRNLFSPEKCLGGDRDHKLILRNAVVTSNHDIAANINMRPLLKQAKRSNSGDEYTYLIYYATTRVPQLSGNREEDHEKGIYHFDIGANSGLVKNISFSKTDQKYVKEARFERDGVDGLGQLREAYDITIQMFGNVQLYPGMYIFVNPVGISPSLGNPTNSGGKGQQVQQASIAHLLGIGGYHLITKVDSIIAEGQFDTTVSAKWVSSGATDKATYDATATDGCGVPEVKNAQTEAS